MAQSLHDRSPALARAPRPESSPDQTPSFPQALAEAARAWRARMDARLRPLGLSHAMRNLPRCRVEAPDVPAAGSPVPVVLARRNFWRNRKGLDAGPGMCLPRSGEFHPVSTPILGRVQGAVHPGEQVVQALALAGLGQAETTAQAAAVRQGHVPHGQPDSFGQARGPLTVGPRAQDEELLPTPTADGAIGRHGLPHPFGQGAQGRIAGQMPEPVVYRLKVVDIKKDQRKRRTRRRACFERLADQGLDMLPIGQFGQGIRGREAAQVDVAQGQGGMSRSPARAR